MIDAEVITLDRHVEASETANVHSISDEDIADDDDDVLMDPLENGEDDEKDDDDQGPPPKKMKLAAPLTIKLKRAANALAKIGSNTIADPSSVAKIVRTTPPTFAMPKAIVQPKKNAAVTRIPKKKK